MDDRTLYDVLEVAPTASPETIHAAYRSLIAQYHPDKVAGLGSDLRAVAAARTAELNDAYQILRDPAKRAAYDEQLGKQAPSPRSRATGPKSYRTPLALAIVVGMVASSISAFVILVFWLIIIYVITSIFHSNHVDFGTIADDFSNFGVPGHSSYGLWLPFASSGFGAYKIGLNLSQYLNKNSTPRQILIGIAILLVVETLLPSETQSPGDVTSDIMQNGAVLLGAVLAYNGRSLYGTREAL